MNSSFFFFLGGSIAAIGIIYGIVKIIKDKRAERNLILHLSKNIEFLKTIEKLKGDEIDIKYIENMRAIMQREIKNMNNSDRRQLENEFCQPMIGDQMNYIIKFLRKSKLKQMNKLAA